MPRPAIAAQHVGKVFKLGERVVHDTLRDQIAGLFRTATPTGRERLVRSFQSWIGNFHAT